MRGAQIFICQKTSGAIAAQLVHDFRRKCMTKKIFPIILILFACAASSSANNDKQLQPTPQEIIIRDMQHRPLYRVRGNRIYDMRWNPLYRIEGNRIYDMKWRPVLQIEQRRP